jgi:DNA polymerase sigma
MELKNGYLVDNDDTIPLLASTEKVLSVLGYAVPVHISSLRSNGLPQEGETEIVFEQTATGSNDDDIEDIDNTSTVVPTDDLKYQGLKRVNNTLGVMLLALEDLKQWRHRDKSLQKKKKEEENAKQKQNGKRVAERHKALEAQRERLQKQLSGDASGENAEEKEAEQERRMNVVRGVNSVAILMRVLLPILMHERRNDSNLRIGTTRINVRNRAQCFLLGEFVFDLMPNKSSKRIHQLLKEFLEYLGGEPSDLDQQPASIAWEPVLEKSMKLALAVFLDQQPENLDFTSVLKKFENPEVASYAKELDDKLGLASTKDEAVHDQYLKSIDNLRQRIQEICKSKVSKESAVSVYGSCQADLSLGKNADVDLSLHVEEAAELRRKFEAGGMVVDPYEKAMSKVVVKVFRAMMSLRKEFRDMEFIPKARVPLVRGTWVPAENPHSENGAVSFDICLLNDIAVANSNLIKEYTLVDPRARQLMILVKQWAKDYNVCSAMHNSLSSYGWINLVIYYLQCIELVPNLQSPGLMEKVGFKRDASNPWHSVRNLDTSFLTWDQVKGVWKQPTGLESVSVSALLNGFFSFYSSQFPAAFYMIAIKRGREALAPKTKFPRSAFFLCIEDPFETCDAHIRHDLAVPVGEAQMSTILNCLRAGARYLDDLFANAEKGTETSNVTRLWPKAPNVSKQGKAAAGGRARKKQAKAAKTKQSGNAKGVAAAVTEQAAETNRGPRKGRNRNDKKGANATENVTTKATAGDQPMSKAPSAKTTSADQPIPDTGTEQKGSEGQKAGRSRRRNNKLKKVDSETSPSGDEQAVPVSNEASEKAGKRKRGNRRRGKKNVESLVNDGEADEKTGVSNNNEQGPRGDGNGRGGGRQRRRRGREGGRGRGGGDGGDNSKTVVVTPEVSAE